MPRPERDWFAGLWEPVRDALKVIQRAVTSRWFEYTTYLIVLANGLILLVQTATMESPSSQEADEIYAPWVSYFFIGCRATKDAIGMYECMYSLTSLFTVYTLEAALKLLGLGFKKYFSSYWNVFDFAITALGIVSVVLEVVDIPMFYVVILRPLRLLTLFRMKRRFRDVFGTAVILYPRLISAIIVLLLTYYFFAIIGMECFHAVKLYDCCKNSSVESFFNYEEDSVGNLYFYLNNFQTMTESGVTLFELTVVNNWFVIMEGHAIASGNDWSRMFFMLFYIFTMIVMTIIVAFILEAFLFRIQYKQFLTKNDGTGKVDRFKSHKL